LKSGSLVASGADPGAPGMKHHLLQKYSFFLIKPVALAAGGWAEQRTAES
jgi:hypothetical protein